MDNSGRKFAFGLYQADPRSGELRKNGMKLRIQEQPFQILLELLYHPGELVTREDLRLKLWPADTFVDFDHGLNTAINKLREVLGDTASNPRFVETLPRRGYRFIAPVTLLDDAPTAPVPLPQAAQSAPAPPSDTQEQVPVAVAVVSPKPTPELRDPDIQDEAHDALPVPSRAVSRTLFALAQLMYLIFYALALINLDEVPALVGNFLGGRVENVVIPIVLVTAAVGIALRLYLLSAALFDYKPLGAKFKTLFPFILPLDQLWALAPFLLVSRIGLGSAFAACAALLYLPFSERTLVKMAYRY